MTIVLWAAAICGALYALLRFAYADDDEEGA